MLYIVGVDLLPHSRGALHFFRTMALGPSKAEAEDEDDRFEAIHVLQDRDLRPMLSHVSLSEVERMARESFETILDEEQLHDRLTAAELVFDVSAERALARRTENDPEAMVVIGRRSPRGGRGWVRLGRVARRLLRSLPGPVAVVPPDYRGPPNASGPVILATSLDSDSAGAVTLSNQLARRWGRPLLAVHVLPTELTPPGYLPAEAKLTLDAAHRRDAKVHLTLWLRRHELPSIESTICSGDVVEQLTSLAIERNAAALVVGSRRLSLRERLFRSSIGSDLAGTATVPVIVAPPPIS